MTQIPPAEPSTFPGGPQPAVPLNLQYSTPAQVGQRPGLLTAVAIISITLGALGVLTNGMGVANGFLQLAFARRPAAFGLTTVTTTTTTGGVSVAAVGPGAATAPTAAPTTGPATAPAGGAAVTTTTTAVATPPMLFTTRAAVLTIVEAALSFLLACFLLVCGILVIRNSPRGRKWHVVYAWMKIPVVLLGAVAGWVVSADMVERMMAAGTPGMPPAPGMTEMMKVMMIASAVVGAALTLIYPVALLIVMKTRRVREFYNFLGGAGA